MTFSQHWEWRHLTPRWCWQFLNKYMRLSEDLLPLFFFLTRGARSHYVQELRIRKGISVKDQVKKKKTTLSMSSIFVEMWKDLERCTFGFAGCFCTPSGWDSWSLFCVQAFFRWRCEAQFVTEPTAWVHFWNRAPEIYHFSIFQC